uniref:NADH-ubiquinone oxidoreductase chain 6 n=1 Tax=Grateloupia filicina TaxID=31455 RepID=A0A343WS92_9FLOR|nr:NADH-ubiquinone oxidoreductase chain 6 [Grateloupia filicina]AWD77499.1 NADH-ubiquinone oxidoreductase chain 6 [Grateloupia filicina]
MSIDFFLFTLFSSFALIASLMVISLKNAVHSVLFLILVFCNIAGLLLLFGAEFLSFMLLIVYVGAIAVLFLFVVMMLNVKAASTTINPFSVLPIGILIFLILFSQLSSTATNFDVFSLQQNELIWISWILEKDNTTNIEVVGKVLYTHYSLLFLLSSLILLVAMIGAIVLTMHQRTDVQKQKIDIQLARSFEGAVKFITLRK